MNETHKGGHMTPFGAIDLLLANTCHDTLNVPNLKYLALSIHSRGSSKSGGPDLRLGVTPGGCENGTTEFLG